MTTKRQAGSRKKSAAAKHVDEVVISPIIIENSGSGGGLDMKRIELCFNMGLWSSFQR